MPVNPTTRSHRKILWLTLAVIALALAGWWWFSRPTEFQYVGCTALPERVAWVGSYGPMIARDAGLLFTVVDTTGVANWEGWANPARIACLDWTGKKQWTITVPGSDSGVGTLLPPNIVTVPPDIRKIESSPDGHVVAAMMPQGKDMLFVSWRDGRKLGAYRMPAKRFGHWIDSPEPALQVLNDGRLFAYVRNTPKSPLFLIKGDLMLATGEHWLRLPKGLYAGDFYRYLSPDAGTIVQYCSQALSVPFDYSTVTVNGEKITATYRYSGTSPEGVPFHLGMEGKFIAGDGTLYGPKGKVRACSGWTVGYMPRGMPDSPLIVQWRGILIRLYNPHTGESWPLPKGLANPIPSEDGKLVLARREDAAATQTIQRLQVLSERFRWLEKPVSKLHYAHDLLLIQRPHRLRARMRVIADTNDNAYITVRGTRYRLFQTVFTGAHKRLAILASRETDHNKSVLLFFTWQ